MQKLTLFVPDDIYQGLHRQIGKGKISHFVSEKIRPYLAPEKTGKLENFFGALHSYAKPVKPKDEERAKREFMKKREAKRLRAMRAGA